MKLCTRVSNPVGDYQNHTFVKRKNKIGSDHQEQPDPQKETEYGSEKKPGSKVRSRDPGVMIAYSILLIYNVLYAL